MGDQFKKLRGFESRELIEAFYFGIHDRAVSATTARSIAASFRQGRMLMGTASSIETLARPIVQYYGVSSMARGLALILRPGISESALKPGHGLIVSDFASTPSDLEVEVSRGLFADVCDALGGSTYRVHSSGPNWSIAFDPPRLGSVVRVVDVASLLPSLDGERRQWTGSDAHPRFELQTFTVDRENSSVGQWTFTGSGTSSELAEMFASPSATVSGLSVKAPVTDVPQLAQTFVFDTVGSVVLRPPVATGLRLGPLQAMLILSYAMSMVARYRPSEWMAVLSGTGDDRFFPFVEAFLDFNEAWFPVLAADHLQRRGDCDYSMLPGTLST